MGSAAATMAGAYANGGKVAGKGTGDKVRTLLDPREVVLPPDTVKAVGLKTLQALIAATHKSVKTAGGRMRRMANGGLVGEDPEAPKPMSYGDQMSNVGSAIANGAGTVAKTVFGAPGYGLNALVTGGSTPPAAPAPTSAVAALANPSTAGAGRGTVNPPVATLSGSARPDLASIPSLGGSTGTAVEGAPGVRKFVQNGSTLYSNVAGPDNDKLMSSNPGVQTVPAMSVGSQQSGSAVAALARGAPDAEQPGTLSSGSGAIILGTPNGLFRAANDPGTPSLSTTSTGGISGREQARLANAANIAAAQNATSRANAQTGAAAQLGSSQIGAGASMYGANTQAGTAVARLAQEAPEVKARTAELAAQAKIRQSISAAGEALIGSKGTEARQAAEENLRAVQGKDHVVRGLAVSLPAQDNGLPGGGAVWDDRTQQFRYPTAQNNAAVAPSANHIAALKANPKLAAQFDAQYGEGASKQYLGAK